MFMLSLLAAISLVGQQRDDAAGEAVCGRLLPDSTLVAVVGADYKLGDFADDNGTWRCNWAASAGSPPDRLFVGYRPVDGPATREYDEAVAGLTRLHYPVESISGIGSAASGVSLGKTFMLYVRTPGAFFSMTGTGLSREQLSALARHIASLSASTISEGRAAVALMNASPAPTPPPLEDVTVRRNGQPLLCEQLLPRAAIVAVMGDSYHLVRADDPRSDLSVCEWKRTEAGYDLVSVSTHGRAEFADAKVSTPAEYYEVEKRFAFCNAKATPLTDLGQAAVLCGDTNSWRAIIRRTSDVLSISCMECTRGQAEALARAVFRPSPPYR